ncbi:hypothetical protein VP01_8472g1, partial [Puccinia sorghi]
SPSTLSLIVESRPCKKRTATTEPPRFTLIQSESSHNAWLKEIQKYCKRSHQYQLLFRSQLANPFLFFQSRGELSGDIEYPLVLMLLKIQKPAKHHLSRWANCIASSIQLTAQEFSFKPPSLGNLTNNNLGSHLLILEYLSSCKTTSGSKKEEGKVRNDMTLKPLYHLHDMIIDLFITYLIIRRYAAADVEPETNSAQSQALVTQKKELDKHCSRHNYTPFCLYLVAGVRGLMLASTNRQFALGATAMDFITAVERIFKKNLPQCKGLETVWKKL